MFGIDWMCMVALMVVQFFFAIPNFVILHVLFRCALCNLQNNQIVSKNERVKRLRTIRPIIHNFMSSKYIFNVYNTNTNLSGQKAIHRKSTFAPSSRSAIETVPHIVKWKWNSFRTERQHCAQVWNGIFAMKMQCKSNHVPFVAWD